MSHDPDSIHSSQQQQPAEMHRLRVLNGRIAYRRCSTYKETQRDAAEAQNAVAPSFVIVIVVEGKSEAS